LRQRLGPDLWAEWRTWIESDAEVYPDLRLQYLCLVLSSTIGGTRQDAAGQARPWTWSDFTPPWRQEPSVPAAPAPPRRALPAPNRDDLPEAFRDGLDDPDLALLYQGDDAGAMTPEQTRAYVATVMALYGGIDPGDPGGEFCPT